MSNNNDLSVDRLFPNCMEQIGDNQYRCTKYNFIITTTVLPIRCGVCKNNNEIVGPSLLQMGKNFTKAVVNHALDGFRRVTEEEYEARIAQCNKNACGAYENGRCLYCGCFLMFKSRWASEQCPLGLWADLSKNGVNTLEDSNKQEK